MTIEHKIAFLGAGNMAGAIIKGLVHGGACQPSDVWAVDIRPGRLEELAAEHGIRTGEDLAAACAWADVVVLCTKPQSFGRLLPELRERIDERTLVVSVAAGVTLAAIERRLPPAVRVVRTMPNTPALVQAGATAIAAGTHARAEDVALVERLFDAVGATVVLEETLLDAVTGLSGSGPAYLFLIIEALSDAGVKMGLGREAALTLAAQTVLGSARLLIETGEHPGRLKDKVTSPGGTTIAGLHALEAGRLRATLIDAVEAATARSRELGAALEAKLSASEER